MANNRNRSPKKKVKVIVAPRYDSKGRKLARNQIDRSQISPVTVPGPAPVLTPKQRAILDACHILGLPDDYTPRTNVDAILKRIERHFPEDESLITVLEGSSDPDALELVKWIHCLDERHLKYVTWDYILAAAKLDGGRMLGLVTEEVYRQWGAVTSVIASLRSPSMMKAAASYGLMPDGHTDRKMVLQASGGVPVPKNQVTNISVKANQIGDRVVNVQGVKSLEEVVGECDTDLNVEADESDLKEIPGTVVKQGGGPVTIDALDSELDMED